MSITSGVDLATVGLRIDGSGAVTTLDRFERSADRAGRSGDRLERTARGLRTALAAMGLALGVREVISYADSWNTVQAQLENIVGSTRLAAVVQGELFASAQRSRQGFEGVVELYTKTAIASKNLGVSQRNVIDFTDTVTKSFAVIPVGAQSAENAIRQLGQALGSGVLRGEELTSVLEQAPRLRQAIAEGMGIEVSALKKLGEQGKLTSKAVFDAIMSQRQAIEEEFAKMPVTIGQGFSVLNNEVRRYIGEGDDVTGASRIMGAGIIFVAENLNTLVKVLGFAALAWGSYNLVLKASAGYAALSAAASALMAAVMPKVTQAAATETVAILSADGAILGYETAALGATAASTAMAGGMTRAAVAAGVLSVAGRGLLAVLTGPVGIALALATVIALLIKHKAASLEAAGATDQFRASLAGMSKTQLQVTEADLDRQIWETERLMAQMRARREDRPGTLEIARERAAALLATDVGQPFPADPTESDAYRRQREQLEALKANRAALEDQAAALAELEIPIARVTAATEAMGSKSGRAMAEFRAGLAEMVREAEHARDASTLQGMAQQESNERFAAANELLRMRADLQQKVFVRDASGNVSGTLSQAQADQLYAEAQVAVANALRLRLETMDTTAFVAERRAREDAARTQQQTIALLTAEGTAQTRLRIEYDATNKAIEAQRNLKPGSRALAESLAGIEEERLTRLAEEQLKIFVDLRRAARDEMRGLFEDIFNNGLSAFGNLFDRARELFGKLVADMASKRLMQAIGTGFTDQLARIYGGAGKLDPGARQQERAAVALTGSAASLTGAASALTLAAARLGMLTPGTGATPGAVAMAHEISAARRPDAVQLQGIVATAKGPDEDEAARESASGFAKAFAKYVAPAMAGYFAGNAVGSGTTTRSLGALGGAASGAAAGFAIGGPLGAAIGGLSGAIGGFLGASKARAEQERMLRETLDRNNERLERLRESFDGFNIMSGKSLAAASVLTAGVGAAGLLGGFLGKIAAGKLGGVSTQDLGEALKGGDLSKGLKAMEQQFGVTFAQLGRIARELGIELYDSAGKLIPDALKQLNEAIQLAIRAATQFGNNLDDIRLRQEARNALFDLNGPDQKLKDAYEQLTALAPDLLKQMGLANLNLDTDAGRKVLLEGLREIFNLIQSGGLTPELLGAFTDKGQLIEAILRAKAGLDAFNQSLGTVTTDFPKAMDIIIYEQRYGRGLGVGGTPPPLTATAPPSSVPAGNYTPNRPPVTFSGPITINVRAGDDAHAWADKTQEAMRIAVSRGGIFVGDTTPAEPLA